VPNELCTEFLDPSVGNMRIEDTTADTIASFQYDEAFACLCNILGRG
jgi:hypothetical protein